MQTSFCPTPIISSTEADLWIHREKNELWWTISRQGEVLLSLEPAHNPRRPGDRVYVIEKPDDPWSNSTRNGHRLEWAALHAKAREFLFTEGTLQQLSPDNAEYAFALLNGKDLSPWHSRRDWQAKAEAAGRNPATTFNSQERAVIRMAATARDTVRAANGQEVLRTLKNKELKFSSHSAFEQYLETLLKSQEGLCAITGIRLQFDGDLEDSEMLCSLDRIDSSGHYEAGNLQIVCQFVNRWKSDSQDGSFRRLIAIVRNTGDAI